MRSPGPFLRVADVDRSKMPASHPGLIVPDALGHNQQIPGQSQTGCQERNLKRRDRPQACGVCPVLGWGRPSVPKQRPWCEDTPRLLVQRKQLQVPGLQGHGVLHHLGRSADAVLEPLHGGVKDLT